MVVLTPLTVQEFIGVTNRSFFLCVTNGVRLCVKSRIVVIDDKHTGLFTGFAVEQLDEQRQWITHKVYDYLEGAIEHFHELLAAKPG